MHIHASKYPSVAYVGAVHLSISISSCSSMGFASDLHGHFDYRCMRVC